MCRGWKERVDSRERRNGTWTVLCWRPLWLSDSGESISWKSLNSSGAYYKENKNSTDGQLSGSLRAQLAYPFLFSHASLLNFSLSYKMAATGPGITCKGSELFPPCASSFLFLNEHWILSQDLRQIYHVSVDWRFTLELASDNRNGKAGNTWSKIYTFYPRRKQNSPWIGKYFFRLKFLGLGKLFLSIWNVALCFWPAVRTEEIDLKDTRRETVFLSSSSSPSKLTMAVWVINVLHSLGHFNTWS